MSFIGFFLKKKRKFYRRPAVTHPFSFTVELILFFTAGLILRTLQKTLFTDMTSHLPGSCCWNLPRYAGVPTGTKRGSSSKFYFISSSTTRPTCTSENVEVFCGYYKISPLHVLWKFDVIPRCTVYFSQCRYIVFALRNGCSSSPYFKVSVLMGKNFRVRINSPLSSAFFFGGYSFY